MVRRPAGPTRLSVPACLLRFALAAPPALRSVLEARAGTTITPWFPSLDPTLPSPDAAPRSSPHKRKHGKQPSFDALSGGHMRNRVERVPVVC